MEQDYIVEFCTNPKTRESYYSESVKMLDKSVKEKIAKAVAKLRKGNFGNCLPLKNDFGKCNSMFELKVNVQNGYRVFYENKNRKIRIVSVGTKKTQRKDVIVARRQLENAM